MKIAIQGHPTRGKEVIQILKSLGGENRYDQSGSNEEFVYFINNIGFIYSVTLQMCSNERKIYTLEEFEKEFPFKVGDKVTDHEEDVAIITGFAYIEEKLGYSLQYENGRGTATPRILKPYKEMKEERNVTLTLEKAKEWYKKGGDLKQVALQAFTEKELTKVDLPKTWEEYIQQNFHREGYVLTHLGDISEITITGLRGGENLCPSKKSAEAHLAMIQLEQLRNCWWNGWEPEWNNSEKYVIKWEKDSLIVFTARRVHAFLAFPTREMTEEFLECFRDLIEKAGDLI